MSLLNINDFNNPIDYDNTSFMINWIANNEATVIYCAKFLNKLELSVKNKYGENITSFTIKLGRIYLIKYFLFNPTFNYYYHNLVNPKYTFNPFFHS